MKKFTKGCLITAVVLLILGCAFCIVFGMAGGFRQIDENGYRVYDIGFGDLKFGYDGSQFGVSYWKDDWSKEVENLNLEIAKALEEAYELPYTAEDIRALDFEIGANNLVIAQSKDEHVWIENKSTNQNIRYGMEGDTLLFSAVKKYHYFFNIPIRNKESKGTIYLYLPKDMQLEEIEMEIGASNLDCMELTAKEIAIEIGAGKANIKGLNGDTVMLEVGAGKAEIDKIEAKQAEVNIGAGKLDLHNFKTEEMNMEVGMGKMNAEGSISKKADVEVGMGNLDLTLQGKEEDYDYAIDCAMGSVNVGRKSFSNLADESSIDNGSGREFRIDCAMGNIDVRFE